MSNVICFQSRQPLPLTGPSMEAAIVHRDMPDWVKADPAISEAVEWLERNGWTITAGSPGRIWCTHDRVMSLRPVDFVIAVETQRMMEMAKLLHGERGA